MYLSKENRLSWKQEHLAHCFCVRIDLIFERNTACQLQFQGGGKKFCSKEAFSAELKRHMYFLKEKHLG
jgi:hypothetical protein